MAWEIASAPFWLLGGTCLVSGTAAMVVLYWRFETLSHNEFKTALKGTALLILASAPLLAVAAAMVH